MTRSQRRAGGTDPDQVDQGPRGSRRRSEDERPVLSELQRVLREGLIERIAERGDTVQHRGLKRLLALIEGDEGPERQRSAECEAAIGLRLLARGAKIHVEVPTKSGHTADFLVHLADRSFALHVKRWTPPIERETETLRVPATLRHLERVRRPYLVGVRWPGAGPAFARFLNEGTRFLHQASVGDEWVFRDADDQPTGGLRILAPWPGDRVVLTVGLDATADDEIARIHRLLRKAYHQFVSDMPNVIALVGGTKANERLIDTAVFGSHVERWDLFPPRGHRVAHGRGDDGFWSGDRYDQSRSIAWLTWQSTRGLGSTRVWFRFRRDADADIRSLLR